MKRVHDYYERAKNEAGRIPMATHAAVARSNVPKALSPQQLDPPTGAIHWPDPLLESEYAENRKNLEQLFELRATTSGSAGTAPKIREQTDQMTSLLRKHMTEMPANDYSWARRFLESLAYSVQTRPN